MKYERIKEVLERLNLNSITRPKEFEGCIFSILALLDDITPNPYLKMRRLYSDASFSRGANVQSIGNKANEIAGELNIHLTKDRETVRDYILKPMYDLGILRKGYLVSDNEYENFQTDIVLDYHHYKSGNNFYVLTESFIKLLQCCEEDLNKMIKSWVRTSRAKELQIRKEANKIKYGNLHSQLIDASISIFVPKYLPGLEVIYVDNADGDRIGEEYKEKMVEANLELGLEDRFPDVILRHPETDYYWFIDAVEHDGEFDITRVEDIKKSFKRKGKRVLGFTTVYRDWKTAYSRQSTYGNLAPTTTMWIMEDAGKVYQVNSVERPCFSYYMKVKAKNTKK
ncbi:BsuBI/PstI family type II restriction endonuclease [Exiguobacterium indicum]|uniref:BsuBI/PstI family type II restriction endonuclease n=1 Tax=Exiguobacterium indicum TaxID=296995 RepID=UPI0039822D7A